MRQTIISADFDQYLTMGIAERGFDLKSMGKMILKTEISVFREYVALF
jgi:hypothetical protein